MALRRSPVLGSFLILFACGGGSPTSPSTVTPDKDLAFQAALTSWAAAPGHYGVSAAVILADGSTWSGVAGQAGSGEPLRVEHLIGIGSITKTMTGAMILQLADERALALDDPVSRWLPVREHVDPAITLRQLLNHTNGLANYTSSLALGDALTGDPSHRFSADELLSFVGPARFPPGARTEYTNTSFILLGQVAERVTGRSIAELYRERLWTRAGISEVFLPGSGAAPGPVAAAQTTAGLVNPADRMALMTVGHSAFGVMGTARAIARWGHELFTGSIISGAMQTEMRRLVPAAGNIPGETGAGLGIRGYMYSGRSQIGHSGASPFANALLLHDPATRVTVVVLMNQSSGADHFTLAPTLLGIAHQ